MDFIEDVEHAIRKEYQRAISTQPKLRNLIDEQLDLTDQEKEIRQDMKDDLRISFRQNVTGRAKTWYNQLDARKRQDWPLVREAFLTRFQTPAISKYAAKRMVENEYNQLAQGPAEPIGEYLQRTDDFYLRHGEEKPELGFKVMEGLQDESKRDLIYVLALQKKLEDYPSIKQMIVNFYTPFFSSALSLASIQFDPLSSSSIPFAISNQHYDNP